MARGTLQLKSLESKEAGFRTSDATVTLNRSQAYKRRCRQTRALS